MWHLYLIIDNLIAGQLAYVSEALLRRYPLKASDVKQ